MIDGISHALTGVLVETWRRDKLPAPSVRHALTGVLVETLVHF